MAGENEAVGDLRGLPPEALPPTGAKEYLAKMLDRTAPPGDDVKPDEKKPDEKKPDAPAPVDHEKRYKDLQSQFTKISQELADLKKKPTETPKPDEKKADEKEPDDKKPVEGEESKAEVPEEAKDAANVVAKAGLDWAAVNDEFAKDGKLSDASYEALEKIGIPRSMVDDWTATKVTAREALRADVLKDVGGADAYAKVVQWAAETLKPEEIAGFNATVNGRDINATKSAIAGLKARYDAAEGIDPKLIQGEGSRTVGYATMAELKSAIADPRYQKDAGYRAEVERKLAASSI